MKNYKIGIVLIIGILVLFIFANGYFMNNDNKTNSSWFNKLSNKTTVINRNFYHNINYLSDMTNGTGAVYSFITLQITGMENKY